MGGFNVYNCLAALGATVLGLNIDPETARQGIANLRGVPGRMEQINMGQRFIAWSISPTHPTRSSRRSRQPAK